MMLIDDWSVWAQTAYATFKDSSLTKLMTQSCIKHLHPHEPVDQSDEGKMKIKQKMKDRQA